MIMDNLILYRDGSPELKDPILIEGLPGVGNVGKLAAEHMIELLGAKKFISVYSKHFPPQVLVETDGLVRLVSNDYYYIKNCGDDKKTDIIFLVGDYQGLTPEGQYDLSYKTLEICKEFNVKRVYTLGGYGQGKMIDYPRVLGAATSQELIDEMTEAGVVFSQGEPGSGIVGASGLLLGLGKIESIEGVCLMGETSGYFVDPKSAKAVLTIIQKILNVELDLSKLEDKADQMEQFTAKLQELEKKVETSGEELRYIG